MITTVTTVGLLPILCYDKWYLSVHCNLATKDENVFSNKASLGEKVGLQMFFFLSVHLVIFNIMSHRPAWRVNTSMLCAA